MPCEQCVRRRDCLRMLAPFVSAQTLATLAQPTARRECSAYQSLSKVDAARAAVRADSVFAALKQQTLRCGGLPASVEAQQVWSMLPDPVRRSGDWIPVHFVELGTVTCLGFEIERQRVRVRLRLQALVSHGYAPGPLPALPHLYSVRWPLIDDESIAWLRPWLPHLEWQCQLTPRGRLRTVDVRIDTSRNERRFPKNCTVKDIDSEQRGGCRVECTLDIPLAHFQ